MMRVEFIDNQPRGIRNNNPGNIRRGENWLGLRDEQTDTAFCQFKEIKYGIRALARILRTYQSKYGLKTVSLILNRFAPSNENDTKSYIGHVASSLGVGRDDAIDVKEEGVMLSLIRSIIRHENGMQPYSTDELLEGIRLV